MLLFGTKARDVFKAWAKKDKQAQVEGTKRLGLPDNNTAADRAKAMGFGDTQYHGTRSDFDEFSLDKASRHKSIYTTPDTSVANKFAAEDFYSNYRVGQPNVMPLKTRGKVFDYENPEHIQRLENEIGAYKYDLSKGKWWNLENKVVQEGIKKLGFDGFNVSELGAKNKGTYNPANIRSPLAHFNPKYAGVGAGSILSADLMADESNKEPTENIWSSLMNTIGSVNQQQAQGAADIGAGAMEGTAGLAKMLVTQPDVVAETVGGGLLKAAGVVSPWIKGAGLGAVLYPSELEDGTLRDENGEYHPHVAQMLKEKQLDEYIASLTPGIHSTEIKLGR